MKRILPGLILLSAITACNHPQKKEMKAIKWPDAKAPIAEIIPHQRVIHGDTVIDNYYWMIDYFKKGPDSTKVVNYLKS